MCHNAAVIDALGGFARTHEVVPSVSYCWIVFLKNGHVHMICDWNCMPKPNATCETNNHQTHVSKLLDAQKNDDHSGLLQLAANRVGSYQGFVARGGGGGGGGNGGGDGGVLLWQLPGTGGVQFAGALCEH